MRMIFWIVLLAALFLLGSLGFWAFKKYNFGASYDVGQEIDSFNGIPVYYNGWFSNIKGRNVTHDGYNLGLKYQCVEFVKRYYYEHLNHKMPNSYGHAKDFFDKSLRDGQKNKARNLFQYTNASRSKPRVSDLLIYKASTFNKFGHVSIVSRVSDDEIEIIQQNIGSQSRETFKLIYNDGLWKIKNSRIVGWLRKAS
jgi:surface antigen